MHKRATEKSVCRLPAHMDDVAYGAQSTADTAARPPRCFPVPKTRRSSRARRSDKARAATPSTQRDTEVHTRRTVRRKNPQRLPSPAAHTLVSSATRVAEDSTERHHHTQRASKASAYTQLPVSHETTRAPMTQRDAGRRVRCAKSARKGAAMHETTRAHSAAAHGGMTRVRRVYGAARVAQNDAGPHHTKRRGEV
ncbi:hypothetical protein C8J57DRAFT_1245158 [Mycena rebaudengoi]|nr:hypothetical protein C8J57DRAFT_1245158 [Mycena rebaudengoi]